jgi:hypothetical protein
MSRRNALAILGGVVAIAVSIALLLPPIRQPAAYHRFADARAVLGVPNALNVFSNLPFLLVAVLGARSTGDIKRGWPGATLLLAVALVGVGSAYYHLAPGDARLVWDRLPMAVVFMAVFAMVIGQWIAIPLGNKLFLPLELAGIGSVILWRQSGDLRAYALVQFLPLLLIPLILVLFPGSRTARRELAIGTGLYVVAKVLELLDGPLYSWGGIVSGHTLKHLVAALAIHRVIRALLSR